MKRINLRFLTLGCAIALYTLSAASGDDDPGRREKTFTVSKGGTLRVEVNVGDINIHTWDKNEVHVLVTGEDEDEELSNIRFRQRENTVSIEYDPEWGPSGDLRFEISIPVQFNVSTETSAGEIRIDGAMTGSLKGETSGGNIRIGSVRGRVELSTSGGDIVTEDIDGDLSLNTSGGDIKVGKVTGATDVHTSGGEISIESCGQSATAETAGGNVSIGDINGDATVSTAGGDITVAKIAGSAKLKTAGGNIDISGANGKVFAKTAGGDIIMENIVGAVDARTSAGNLEIELTPSGTGKSVLTTSVGDAILHIAENTKAVINARVRVQGWWRGSSDNDYFFSDFKEDSYEKSGRDKEVRATYTLNGGGKQISILTTMGNIHIKKTGTPKHSGKRKSKER